MVFPEIENNIGQVVSVDTKPFLRLCFQSHSVRVRSETKKMPVTDKTPQQIYPGMLCKVAERIHCKYGFGVELFLNGLSMVGRKFSGYDFAGASAEIQKTAGSGTGFRPPFQKLFFNIRPLLMLINGQMISNCRDMDIFSVFQFKHNTGLHSPTSHLIQPPSFLTGFHKARRKAFRNKGENIRHSGFSGTVRADKDC